MNINKAYLARIRRMTPSQRLLLALELTKTVREIAIKGIIDSEKVSHAKARKILQTRLIE